MYEAHLHMPRYVLQRDRVTGNLTTAGQQNHITTQDAIVKQTLCELKFPNFLSNSFLCSYKHVQHITLTTSHCVRMKYKSSHPVTILKYLKEKIYKPTNVPLTLTL